MGARVRIVSIDTALKIYYAYPEIGNKEIGELFGTKSASTIYNKKKKARTLMLEKGQKPFDFFTVSTATAYEAWGSDVEDLEKRRNKLKKLNLT